MVAVLMDYVDASPLNSLSLLSPSTLERMPRSPILPRSFIPGEIPSTETIALTKASLFGSCLLRPLCILIPSKSSCLMELRDSRPSSTVSSTSANIVEAFISQSLEPRLLVSDLSEVRRIIGWIESLEISGRVAAR